MVDLVVRSEGSFERWYACKRLHAHLREPAFRAMFLDEGRLAGTLRHPNVLSVLDVGEDGEGPYLIMDFLEGLPAARLLSWAAERGQRLPVQIAARIALEAARGLHAAHEATAPDGRPLGLIHRDVSPQNILIGFDGTVRVSDFGIAKALGNTTRTSTGLLKGRIGYLAPELLRFEEADRRSDLFALGVTLYELLACERLYAEDDGPATARRILNEPPPDIADVRDDVPAELVELLVELLARDRALRPPHAQHVASRLEAVVADCLEDEGPVDLAAFMQANFEDEHRARHAELSRLVTDVLSERARRGRLGLTRRRRALAAFGIAVVVATAAVVAASIVRRPAARPPPGGAPTVWAGLGGQSCALEAGSLFCWGQNNDGQVGGGTTDRNAPRQIPGLANVVSVGAGGEHTCACTAAGEIWCWGRNDRGVLGIRGERWVLSPARVPGVDCVAVACGGRFTCAVNRAGRVLCWGDARVNMPASAFERSVATTPAEIPGLDGVAELAAGWGFVCARRGDGRISCWGRNEWGQLGDGTRAERLRPTAVTGIADAVAISAGATAACARRASAPGQVSCWGASDRALGGRRLPVDSAVPSKVPGIEDAVQIAVGGYHVCVLRRSGALLCFGDNSTGQLGHGGEGSSLDPVPVAEIQGVTSIAAGMSWSCARHEAGLSCWGDNARGKLGDGSSNRKRRPVSVVGFLENAPSQ